MCQTLFSSWDNSDEQGRHYYCPYGAYSLGGDPHEPKNTNGQNTVSMTGAIVM